MKRIGVFGLGLLVLSFGVLMIMLYNYLISEHLIYLNPTKRNSIADVQTQALHEAEPTWSTPSCSSNNNKIKRDKVSYLMIPKDFNASFALNACMGRKPISWTMYIFVKSAAFNFRNREILRRTWASVSYINGGRLAIVFVIGTTSESNQNLVEEENRRYRDILQINSSDAYGSIAHKTLAGMQWAQDNLPDDHFYSSADDDFLINLGRLQEIIDEHRKVVAEKMWTEFPILCMYRPQIGDIPIRNLNSKHYISYEEYKWPHWPDYCLGGMYVTSVKVARMLWEASRTAKILKTDDVWITGILRETIGMPRQYIRTIQPSAAEHYRGFSDKDSVSAKEYVNADWKEKYKFSNRTIICRHDSSD